MEMIYVAIIFFCYLSAYIISLYALAVYIDPDDIEKLLPESSKYRKKLLLKMSGDPRAFLQISEVFKSFVLIVITYFAVLLGETLTIQNESIVTVVNTFGLLFVWIIFIVLVEILPRYSSREAINSGMVKYIVIIYPIYLIFYPIVKLFRRGSKKTGYNIEVSEEEKEDIVERAIETVAEHAGIGETIVDEEEKEMINQIFLLDQTIAREIMIPRMDIVAFDCQMSFKDIKAIIKKDGHSRYPVYEKTIDKTLGLVYVKDFFNDPPEPGERFNITKYIRKPFIVPESKIIGELLKEFKYKHQHIAIVVDEYGGVSGLVTLEDIIEEIFGEIQDEHDSEEDDIVRLKNGRYKVNATLLIETLQDFLDTEYDQGNYDTVGGLIYDLVGSVPDEGQRVKWNDIEFEICEVEGQRILTVKVRYYKNNKN